MLKPVEEALGVELVRRAQQIRQQGARLPLVLTSVIIIAVIEQLDIHVVAEQYGEQFRV